MSCQALRRGTITETTVRKLPDHVLCQALRRGTITEITVRKLPDHVSVFTVMVSRRKA
jgi:hypothetical protein